MKGTKGFRSPAVFFRLLKKATYTNKKDGKRMYNLSNNKQ